MALKDINIQFTSRGKFHRDSIFKELLLGSNWLGLADVSGSSKSNSKRRRSSSHRKLPSNSKEMGPRYT